MLPLWSTRAAHHHDAQEERVGPLRLYTVAARDDLLEHAALELALDDIFIVVQPEGTVHADNVAVAADRARVFELQGATAHARLRGGACVLGRKGGGVVAVVCAALRVNGCAGRASRSSNFACVSLRRTLKLYLWAARGKLAHLPPLSPHVRRALPQEARRPCCLSSCADGGRTHFFTATWTPLS